MSWVPVYVHTFESGSFEGEGLSYFVTPATGSLAEVWDLDVYSGGFATHIYGVAKAAAHFTTPLEPNLPALIYEGYFKIYTPAVPLANYQKHQILRLTTSELGETFGIFVIYVPTLGYVLGYKDFIAGVEGGSGGVSQVTYDQWHKLRVEADQDLVLVYLDNVLQFTLTISPGTVLSYRRIHQGSYYSDVGTEVAWDDVVIYALQTPTVMVYVTTIPEGIPFTFNGVQVTGGAFEVEPYSVVTLVFPSSYVAVDKTYALSHVVVDDGPIQGDSYSYEVDPTWNPDIIAHYVEVVPEDTLEATVDGYTVWLSGLQGDHYVKNEATGVVMARFPTYEEALAYAESLFPTPPPPSKLPLLILGAAILLSSRRR